MHGKWQTKLSPLSHPFSRLFPRANLSRFPPQNSSNICMRRALAQVSTGRMPFQLSKQRCQNTETNYGNFFNKRYQTEIPAQYLTDGPGYRRCGYGSSRRFPGALSSLAGNHVETMRTSATTVNLQHYRMLEMHITKPHHHTMYTDAAYCYRPSSVVCLSVCLSQSRALQNLLNQSRYRYHLGCELGWA